MPTFSYTSSGFPFTPFTKILSADVNQTFNDIKTFFNTTKLDSANVQLAGLTVDRLIGGTNGQVLSSVGTTPTWSSLTDMSNEIVNLGITASVSANALTIALKTKAGTDPSASDIVQVGFRNSTVTTGTYNVRSISSALSMVVSSGSSLGHVAATAAYIYVYLIDNAGTPEVAVSSTPRDEGSLVSTTAEGGAGAADSASVLYSTAARTNVPVRLITRLKSTQTTAGTWAVVPTETSIQPFNQTFQPATRALNVDVDTGNGYGSGSTKIRRFSNSVSPGYGFDRASDGTLGDVFTCLERGIYTVVYVDRGAGATSGVHGLSVNSNELTTNVQSIAAANRLAYTNEVAGEIGCVTFTGVFNVGDVLRAHTDGQQSTSSAFARLYITQLIKLT